MPNLLNLTHTTPADTAERPLSRQSGDFAGHSRQGRDTLTSALLDRAASSLNFCTSLRRSAPSARAATTKGLPGRRTRMITVSYRECPDPNGVDPLAADEPRAVFRPPVDRMPRRPSADRSREGAVDFEETVMLDSNLPSVPRRDPWNKGAPYWAEAPSEAQGRVVDPGPAPVGAPSSQPRLIQPRDRQQTPGLRSRAAAGRRCQH